MTEKRFWDTVLRPLLHDPAKGSVAYKVQDAFVKGLPDVVANVRGKTFWIELKVLAHAPVREGSEWKVGVTKEQRRWLQSWNRASLFAPTAPGERSVPHTGAFVLLWLAREKRWYKVDAAIPDSVAQRDFGSYVLAEGTRDSLQELFA